MLSTKPRSLRSFWIALLLLVISAFPLLSVIGAGPEADMTLYRTVAERLLAGEMPYRDLELGYPPYAVVIFLIPKVLGFGNDEFRAAEYQFRFAVLVLIADSIVKCLLLLKVANKSDPLRALLPLALYCLCVPFIRFFYLQRYDIFPSLMTIGAIYCFARGWFGWSGACLMVGAGMKIYPAVLLPALWILAVKRHGGIRFTAGIVAALIPLVVLSFFLPWWRFITCHTERGLQVESLYASIIWLGHLAGIADAAWTPAIGCVELRGPLSQAALPWARGLFTTVTLASVCLSVWVSSRCSQLTISQISRLVLVPLIAFIAFNLVFSPQYMIWLLPLAALGVFGGAAWPMVTIAMATAVTPIFFPSPEYMTGLSLEQTIVLVCRNVSLVIVWLALLREFWRVASQASDMASGDPVPTLRQPTAV